MSKDTVALAALAGGALIAATVTNIVTGSIPEVLGSVLTVTVGAFAGGAYASRRKGTEDEPSE